MGELVTMLFEGTAYAQTASQQAARSASEQVIFTTIIPLALLFAIFYFILIRPQTTKAREHEKLIANLKRNDEVVTTGGLLGRIVDVSEKVITLEVAKGVQVRVERPQIAALSPYGKTAKKE